MNPIDQYPNLRRGLYLVQWVYNGAAAVLGAFFVANQTPVDALPRWYVLALAIAPVLWTYLGRTAQTNVTEPVDLEPATFIGAEHDAGPVD